MKKKFWFYPLHYGQKSHRNFNYFIPISFLDQCTSSHHLSHESSFCLNVLILAFFQEFFFGEGAKSIVMQNFYCYAIFSFVFGPNFRSGGKTLPREGGAPHCRRKRTISHESSFCFNVLVLAFFQEYFSGSGQNLLLCKFFIVMLIFLLFSEQILRGGGKNSASGGGRPTAEESQSYLHERNSNTKSSFWLYPLQTSKIFFLKRAYFVPSSNNFWQNCVTVSNEARKKLSKS